MGRQALASSSLLPHWLGSGTPIKYLVLIRIGWHLQSNLPFVWAHKCQESSRRQIDIITDPAALFPACQSSSILTSGIWQTTTYLQPAFTLTLWLVQQKNVYITEISMSNLGARIKSLILTSPQHGSQFYHVLEIRKVSGFSCLTVQFYCSAQNGSYFVANKTQH